MANEAKTIDQRRADQSADEHFRFREIDHPVECFEVAETLDLIEECREEQERRQGGRADGVALGERFGGVTWPSRGRR